MDGQLDGDDIIFASIVPDFTSIESTSYADCEGGPAIT